MIVCPVVYSYGGTSFTVHIQHSTALPSPSQSSVARTAGRAELNRFRNIQAAKTSNHLTHYPLFVDKQMNKHGNFKRPRKGQTNNNQQ